MKLMGIDYGSKRVGVALSDEGGRMAFPHAVFPNDDKLLKTLVDLVTREKVAEIVIGHSLDKNGKPNKVHEAVEELMGDLTLHLGVPIHLEPEQYSTQEALHTQGRNEKTDASAAAIILNSYMTRKK